jgi:hypothetical protein
MHKPVSIPFHAPLILAFATVAGARDLPVQAAAVPADATSWPWIAACAIVLTLGAIAWSSRRRSPFGNVG